MPTRHRLLAPLLVALVVGACGGSVTSPVGPATDPTSEEPEEAGMDDGDDTTLLSPCTPADGVEQRTVVEATGPRPSPATIDAALEDRPDLAQLLASLEHDGVSSEDARHEAYAQVVGMQLFEDLQDQPGYVPGRIARPTRGEPFLAAFSGEVPDGFDPSSHELESYGLEVITGAPGFDQGLIETVGRAAEEAGLRVVDVTDDIWTGTVEVAVLKATPEQVAAFEAALEDPTRGCLVQVPPDLPCNDDVVAAAQAEAVRQGEVITGGTESQAAADTVRRSHLGMDVEASQQKAADEQRGWRIVAEDGVEHAVTADLNPGRLNVTACQGVVVEAFVEGVESDEG